MIIEAVGDEVKVWVNDDLVNLKVPKWNFVPRS